MQERSEAEVSLVLRGEALQAHVVSRVCGAVYGCTVVQLALRLGRLTGRRAVRRQARAHIEDLQKGQSQQETRRFLDVDKPRVVVFFDRIHSSRCCILLTAVLSVWTTMRVWAAPLNQADKQFPPTGKRTAGAKQKDVALREAVSESCAQQLERVWSLQERGPSGFVASSVWSRACLFVVRVH